MKMSCLKFTICLSFWVAAFGLKLQQAPEGVQSGNYRKLAGQACGGTDITKWNRNGNSNGEDSGFGSAETNLDTCKSTCEAEYNCNGFEVDSSGICTYWKKLGLTLSADSGKTCYMKTGPQLSGTPTEYSNDDYSTWGEALASCENRGQQLCTREQLCPGYDATMIDSVHGTSYNGKGCGDKLNSHCWIATADYTDAWVAFGTGMNGLSSWPQICKMHGENYGPRPCGGWGNPDADADSCEQTNNLFCCPVEEAKAGGDPHVQNIKGEKFNINRQGYAPLVSITSEGTSHLEIMALIEGVKRCQKKMFITEVNASGSWLEKSVMVQVGSNKDNRAFTLAIDGKEVWSPVAAGYQPPTDQNTVFNHAGKFSINEVPAIAPNLKATPALELKTTHDVKMKITRPLHRPTAPPHLNFDIQGLAKVQRSFTIGGLLGRDDHSSWTARDENCGINFAHTEIAEGSVAVAH